MAKNRPEGKRPEAPKFGIGEWYGQLYHALGRERRVCLAHAHENDADIACPFKPGNGGSAASCSKEGGVCSIKLYARADNGSGVPVTGAEGRLRVTCPSRFGQGGIVEKWIGQELLGTPEPIVVTEVGFLSPERAIESSVTRADTKRPRKKVGRIDQVLVHPEMDPFRWCAVEVQAVYFSGPEMKPEFEAASVWGIDEPPFPQERRRPDYRSSGPKRLMPQLETKVPTLRRWGKMMAVVVDEAFFYGIGTMDDVGNPSNADIGWFVVRLTEAGGVARLEPGFVRYTTLERAVEGLTAGHALTQPEFESEIKAKLEAQQHRS